MAVKYGALPFTQQSELFRAKNPIPTEHWNDLTRDGHDTGFMVAGAMKADLVTDLQGAIQKAIDKGTTLTEFRRDFKSIVAKHGWTGWTGSDTEAGIAWRTKLIYETNLRSSYQAGRWQQIQAGKAHRPYLQYHHSHASVNARDLHVSWHGKVLSVDDPWWKSHYPPNGYGCKCTAHPLSERDLKKLGKDRQDPAPDDGTYPWVDPKTGQSHTFPNGVQPFWDYVPGKSVVEKLIDFQQRKLDNIPWQIARSNVQDVVNSPIFQRFFNGEIMGEFPIAILPAAEQALLGSESQTVLLSQESLAAHVDKHPDVVITDYLKIQQIIEEGELYRQGDERLVFLMLDGIVYRAALKRTLDGKKNYFLTLFRTDDVKADKEIRGKFERIR